VDLVEFVEFVDLVEFVEFCGLVHNVIKSTIFGKVRFRPRECPNDPWFLISRNPPNVAFETENVE
jgi:hypothetical protein